MAKHLVPCIRPEMPAWTDGMGNVIGEARPQVTFEAAFAPPTTEAGSEIVDGALREITITKPTLYEVVGSPDIRSGDPITVDGVTGWEVDGDAAQFVNPFTGWRAPLVIELRRTAG